MYSLAGRRKGVVRMQRNYNTSLGQVFIYGARACHKACRLFSFRVLVFFDQSYLQHHEQALQR